MYFATFLNMQFYSTRDFYLIECKFLFFTSVFILNEAALITDTVFHIGTNFYQSGEKTALLGMDSALTT